MASFKGKSLCISSSKGGVGKTFITTSLAGIFAKLEKKVLILDFDLSGGSIAVSLNTPFEKSLYNLVEDIDNNRYKNFDHYVTHYSGNSHIDFIASPKDPRQAIKIDSRFIEIVLDKAVANYDVVLIDTNHDLNEFNVSLMDKVDEILFVLTNDVQDIKNMRSLLTVFQDIDLDYYKILLNNSRDPFKKYFSLYDIKNILKDEISYSLSPEFFIKNIDLYVLDGKIVTLDSKMANVFKDDYITFMTIATEFLEGKGK